MGRRLAPRPRRGFTLIEVIIALALMSLIMLGLVSAFSTLGKTATRLDERAGASGREWLLSEFLRESLSSSTGQFRRQRDDGSETVYFHGDADSLQWLGLMPARHGVGGLYLFSLDLEAARGGGNLLLRYEPYVKDAAPGAVGVETLVLVEKVGELRIAYQSKPERVDEDPVWLDAWTEDEKLPARVRIDLVAGGTRWPPVIAALGAIDSAGRRRGAATVNMPSVGG